MAFLYFLLILIAAELGSLLYFVFRTAEPIYSEVRDIKEMIENDLT